MWTQNQFPYFLWMMLCGAGIMFCYDFLRIHRRISSVPDFAVNLEDFIFAIISAVAVFYITYLKNDGEIRWQTAVGLICGGGIYVLVIRNKFVKLACRIWKIFAKILTVTVKFILAPFVFLMKIILKPARLIFWYSGKGLRCVKRRIKIKGAKTKIRLKNIGYIMRKK